MSSSVSKQALQRSGRWARAFVYWFLAFIVIAGALVYWRAVTGPPDFLIKSTMSRYKSPEGWRNGDWPFGRMLNFDGVERAPETFSFSMHKLVRYDKFLGFPLVNSITVTRTNVLSSSPLVDSKEAMWDYLLWQDHYLQESIPFWPEGGYYAAMTTGKMRAAQWYASGVVALVVTAGAAAFLPLLALRVVRSRVRARRGAKGLCTTCGYARGGLDHAATCPECGAAAQPPL